MDAAQMIELYKVQNDNHRSTRELQWKFNITFWTLITAATYAVIVEGMYVDEWLMLLLLSAFIGAAWIFAHLTQKSLAMSRAAAEYITSQLSDSTGPYKFYGRAAVGNAKIKGKAITWIIFQVLVTIVLSVLLWTANHNSSKRSGKEQTVVFSAPE